MSVVIDTGEIAIAQGNSVRHMRQWDDDDKFVGKAENDRNDASWGRKLNQSNDKHGYVFEDSYICFSFLVKRDSFLEFWYPGYVTFKINGEEIWHQKNFGPKYSGIPESEQDVYIYASCNDATGDKRTLVHINVPTRRISHLKTIETVSCSIGHGFGWVNRTEEAVWNFTNNSIKVHQYYRWYKDGDVYNLTNSGSDDGNGNNGYFQTPKAIKRKETTSTKVTLKSKQLEDTTNNYFFTESGGKINLIFSLEKYLHDSRYRVPNKCIFYGTPKNSGVKDYVEIDNINDNGELISDDTITHIIDSSKFKDLKDITSAKIYFSGHGSDEIKGIGITNSSFKNCDLYENVPIKINVDSTKRVVNHYDSMEKTKVFLHSFLQGTVDTSNYSAYPFKFNETNSAYLIGQNEDTKYNKVKISFDSQKKPIIEIREDYTGSVDAGSFKYDRSCEPDTSYWLKSTVTNLLKTEVSGDSRNKTISFLGNDAKIVFQNNPSTVYVALNGPSPSIKYIKDNILYKVPGSIILDGERLYFENDVNKAFKVYNLNDRTLRSNAKGYIVINDKSTNLVVLPGANYLRKDLASDLINTNETTNITISYTFKDGDEILTTMYPFKDHFIFGRLTNTPVLEILKTRDKAIRYYLKDNTGDRDLKIGDKVLSSNQLIDRRTNKQGYFSLSREPVGSNLTQEKLTVQIKVATNDEEGNLIYVNLGNPINLKINDDNLEEVLGLLKENQTNSFEFSETFFNKDDIKNIDLTSIEEQVGFDLILEYIYEKDGGGDSITEPLLEISVRDVSFSTTIEPIGLRKRGVIINPEKNQNLGPLDNFQINVDNNKYTTKTEDGKDIMIWQKQNGLKIVFKTGDKDLDGNSIILPTFEIYLGEDGAIHLSNCVIDPAPTAET